MTNPVYVLGGAQTDFARNWSKEGLGLVDMFAETVPAALADARVDDREVGVIHVSNLAGELFAGQAQLGGMVVAAVPGLDGLPSTRHEAACASGSTAILAACADIESGRYDVALVVGVELMRNVSAQTAAEYLGTAAWAGREALGAKYPWPALFADIAQEYAAALRPRSRTSRPFRRDRVRQRIPQWSCADQGLGLPGGILRRERRGEPHRGGDAPQDRLRAHHRRRRRRGAGRAEVRAGVGAADRSRPGPGGHDRRIRPPHGDPAARGQTRRRAPTRTTCSRTCAEPSRTPTGARGSRA